MKNTNRNTKTAILSILASAVLMVAFTGCDDDDDSGNPEPPTMQMTTVATGLHGPMGIEADSDGNLWVTEAGTDTVDSNGSTHNNTGKVIMITPNGDKYDAIIHLSSYANVHSGELQGAVNLFLDGDMLYVLSGDYLYHTDISGFHPGDTPLDANVLPSEDIAAVISQIPSTNNPDADSHPYNLTKGPDGDLYIADAGANAIVRRNGVNDYSVFAEFPAIPNPSFPGLGGPTVQVVPTAILFDGTNFLVTALTGFPFPSDQASVYSVSTAGEVSVYETGFTALVDEEKGDGSRHLMVQHAASFNPATGFEPNSGSLIWADGTSQEVLADGLNMPVAIKQVDEHTWYVVSLGDGSVVKVTYM